jgi:hypothetical protein
MSEYQEPQVRTGPNRACGQHRNGHGAVDNEREHLHRAQH